MKFSILNLAKLGMAVLFLNLFPSLQADEEIQALKDIHQFRFDCVAKKDVVVGWLGKETIVPDSILHSEELWRFNAIFLKDSLQVIAFGSDGDEISVISGHIINNAEQIGRYLARHSELEDEIHDVELLLVTQAITLDAYTLALLNEPEEIPALESILQTQNGNLLRSLAKIIGVRGKARAPLALALKNRLEALKEVSQGFVRAHQSDDFAKGYHAFNYSLRANQELGSLIGRAFFNKH